MQSVSVRSISSGTVKTDSGGWCRVGVSAPRLTIDPSAGFNAGELQITGLSIQHKDFAERGLTPIDLCRCTVPLSAGVCGVKEQPSCMPPVCPRSGPGQCTPGYGSNSIATAYDGLIGREDGYMTTIQQNQEQISTHAIEVDLGSTMEVCGVQLYWDAARQYARTWRVLGSDGSDYDLWAEAAPEGEGKEVISGAPAWDVATPNKAGQVAQNDYGLACVNARRVRLEMEDSESTLFFKLLEFRLLTGDALACGCRHGGVCLDGGGCTCPAEAHPTCVKPECGWSGTSCSRADCVDSVSCNNFGTCTGANTCTCRIGWHGTVGAAQCIAPRCGDRGVTTSVLGGGETCDDGNLVDGDGCSATCHLEPFHPERLPETPSSPALYILRDYIFDETINEHSVASALMNRCTHYQEQCLRRQIGPNPLELCDVDIGRQCLVGADQIVTFDPVCTSRGRELFSGFAGCAQAGGREEVKYEFKELSCSVQCYNGGSCSVTANACLCLAGWEGDDCSISQCRRGCDHGGTCVGVDDCGVCGDGWSGEFCGTATGFLAALTIVLAAATCILLAASAVLTCYRASWVPIRARGATNLLVKFIGGIFWIATAVCSIWGEAFEYDVRWGPDMPAPWGTCMVSVNSPWDVRLADWPRASDGACLKPISCTRDGELSDDCKGNANKWQFWYTLVFGFGLWLASNLSYLRSLIRIHIRHKLPFAFIALAIFMLAPWMLASWLGSPFLALGLGFAYLVYAAMLYAELWPIRADFLDVKHHVWGCSAAIINVMFQIWIVQGGRVGRRIDWDLDWDFEAVVPATLATVNALATVSIVAAHFYFTVGRLLYLAVVKAEDPSVLEGYYDEYRPDDTEDFRAQMHTFDHQISTHAQTLDDQSLHGRIARRRFQGGASVKEEQQGTRIEHHCGWKSCLLFPFTAGLVYLCPVDRREVYVRDGSPVEPLCHHKVRNAIKTTYRHVAHNTTIGHHIHRHAYHRKQFGARKKLKVQTLEGMGRRADESTSVQVSPVGITWLSAPIRCWQPGIVLNLDSCWLRFLTVVCQMHIAIPLLYMRTCRPVGGSRQRTGVAAARVPTPLNESLASHLPPSHSWNELTFNYSIMNQ